MPLIYCKVFKLWRWLWFWLFICGGIPKMCEGHPHCTCHPVFTVTMHRIGMCNKPPGATATYALCSACARSVAYRLGEMIGAAYEAMPECEAGQTLRCQPCQLLIHDLSDVFDVEWVTEVRTA